jgi:transmembrane sensor
MPEAENDIQNLFEAYLKGDLTREDFHHFFRLLQATEPSVLSPALQQLWAQTAGVASVMDDQTWNEKFLALKQQVEGKVKVRRMQGWTKWVAAAVVILLIGSVIGITLLNKENPKPPIAKVQDIPPPDNNRAVLTLADGTKLYLDSAGSGTLAIQEHINVERSKDGKIIYQPANGMADRIVYNTLTNPRGSKVIDIQLTDRTHVWLNAGSSLRYPVAFLQGERKVEVDGEAYFEVTHDATMPFIVTKGSTEVRVLGTHFNVNAYGDEPELKVTLLEGSVKVSQDSASGLLHPGEQAQVSSGITITKGVDLEQVMAWKNGKFAFEGADIKEIMRQVGRWYDLDVVYQRQPSSDRYRGKLSRDLSLMELVRLLEINKLKIKLEGKVLTIAP